MQRFWRVVGSKLWLYVAAVVLVVLCAHQLLRDEVRIAGTSGVSPQLFVAELNSPRTPLCQSQDTLPRTASRIVLTIGTYGKPGPALTLRYFRDGRTVGTGRLAKGWGEGPVAIPLARRAADLEGVQLCIRSTSDVRLAFAGEPSSDPARVGRTPQTGRVAINGYTAGGVSTGSLLDDLASELGRGNAALVGPWTLWLIGLLVVAGMGLGAFAVRLSLAEVDDAPGSGSEPTVAPPAGADPSRRARTWRGLRSAAARIPPAGFAVAAVTCAMATCWALLTPPFQVPDETSHVAYVQYLAETGKLPVERTDRAPFSPLEAETLGALGFGRIIGRPAQKVVETPAQERYLRSIERGDLSPEGAGNAATASNNPPLYYALQTPIYWATSGQGLLTQVLAMRFLSVLFTTLTALLTFLFVRELLPRSPWAWTAGGLAVALQPVLGFIGSGVNPDSLLFLCGTGMLLSCARILRRGLTVRRGVALGLFVLAGLLTKPLFLSLIPAAALALAASVLWRPPSTWRGALRQSWRPLAATAAVVVVPMVVYVLLAAGPLDHPYFAVASNVASGATGAAGPVTSVSKELSFVLQQFLPRLPFLTDFVPGEPVRDVWLTGLVGVFGWVDYGFPYPDVAFGVRVFELLLVLGAVALVVARRRLLGHLPLAVVCLTALTGVLLAVGVTDYQAFLNGTARFSQARYLFPVVALYGGLFALAAKGTGRRPASLLLPALWVLLSLHSFAALVLTANRYYL